MRIVNKNFVLFVFCICVLFSQLVQAQRIWIPGWKATESFNVERAGSAIVEANGVIYAIGGIDGHDFLASSEYSQIDESSGHLSPWTLSSQLNVPRGFFDAVSHNGYIYVVGGGNGPSGHNLLRSVERAKILADGSLGPWEFEKNTLNLPRRCVKLILFNNRIYAFGGFGGTFLDTIESAPILEDGHLGEWRIESNTLTMPRYVHAGKKTANSIIITGGHNQHQGEGLKNVEWASLGSTPLRWQTGQALQTGRYGHSSLVIGDYIYVLGGLEKINYTRNIEKSLIDEKTGAPTEWVNTNPLSVALANFGVVTFKDYIYILGGTNQDGYYNNVEFTSVNDRGDLGFWGSKKEAGEFERWENPLRSPSKQITLEHHGVVIDSILAGSYSYLQVQTAHNIEWVAGPAGHYPINTQVEYSTGIMMRNFHSDTIDRTFEHIRFVGKLNTISNGHTMQHSH